METNRLRQFKVLVETKHLRKAAEILGISHAGLYKSLKTLEAELSFSLFYSKGKRLEITEKGLKLYHKIPNILSSVQELMVQDKLIRPTVFTLGTFEVFSTHLLGHIFQDKNWEWVQVRISELIPGDLEKAIAEKKIDLGITYLPIPTPGIEFYRVNSIRMGVYCRKNSFKGVETMKLPFVVPICPVEGTPTGVKGLDGWPNHLFPRQVFYEVELMESALELVRLGKAAAFLPEPVVKKHNEKHISSFQLEDRPLEKRFPVVKREIFIIRKASRIEDKNEKRLASALRMIH